MAPEKVHSMLVLDLEENGDQLFATRYHADLVNARFLVKWYPLSATPQGFQSVGNGVVYIPQTIEVWKDRPELPRTQRGYEYKDYAAMLVMVLPARRTATFIGSDARPRAAKVTDGRLALYWLATGEEVEVAWSLAPSDADPQRLASGINADAARAKGALPCYSLDDHEYYDAALSFASENREPVQRIAQLLRDAGKHIFYDEDQEAMLWGKDLKTTLGEIYQHRSRYCVVFSSRFYAEKMWTNLERKHALQRALELRGQEYVLPVLMDETLIEGIPESVHWLRMDRGPAYVVERLLEKLRRP